MSSEATSQMKLLHNVRSEASPTCESLNILMVFHSAPQPPPFNLSSTKRNLPFLLENLSRHKVSVLALGSRAEEQRFNESYGDKCEQVVFVDPKRPKLVRIIRHLLEFLRGRSQARAVFYHKKMQRALNELTAKHSFDLIHCTSVLMGFYDFPQETLVVGDTQNVEFDLAERISRSASEPLFKAFSRINAKWLKKDELANCKKFRSIIAPTWRDAAIWREFIPYLNISVIENGVDKEFFEFPKDVEKDPNGIVFVGLMDYYPNRHGAKYFIDKILPLIRAAKPDATFYVVGAKPTKEILAYSSDHITVTGFVDDVRPYVAKSKVFVIPLLMGGGIRGKALEAMAMQVPIVSTTIGIEGIKLVKDESVLIGESPEEFAREVIRLLEDAELRKRLSDNAYRTVVESYDWSDKGNELNEVYHDVFQLKRKKSRGR